MHRRRLLLAATAVSSLALVAACGGTEDTGPAPVQYTATLIGANERPVPVSTTASGTAVLGVRPTSVDYTINVTGLTAVTAAHIHAGGTAVAGPIVATLYAPASPSGAVSGELASGTISAGSAQLATGVTIDSLISLINNNAAYVNVHTTASPNGVIRGHAIAPGGSAPPERYTATLVGANERPNPVTTTAAGTADYEVRGDSIAFIVNITSPIDSVTIGHIHKGDATVAGSVGVDLLGIGGFTTTRAGFTGVLKQGRFGAGNIVPTVFTNMDTLKVYMRTGQAYTNMHTRKNGGGEIRGQISPVTKNQVTVP